MAAGFPKWSKLEVIAKYSNRGRATPTNL